MLKGASYSMLLNHKEHNIIELYSTEEVVMYDVTILGENKNYFKFKWKVERY